MNKRKRNLFSKTHRRIVLVCMSVVFSCLIVFSLITLITYNARVYRTIDQQLATYKNTILTSNDLIKESGENTKVVLPAPFTPNIISFVWLDGELVQQSSNHHLLPTTKPVFPENYKGEFVNLPLEDNMYRGVSFEHDGLIIQLVTNINSEVDSMHQLLQALLISLFLLIALALALSRYLAFMAIKPIRKAYHQQSYFIQDAAHEMRTPLAVIKGQLEVILRKPNDSIASQLDQFSQMMTELNGIQKLNSDLLLLSKEDMGIALELTSFSLDEFLKEIGEFYYELADFQTKRFQLHLPQKSIEVYWDRSKVKRALIILLENAFRYTQINDTISLSVTLIGKNLKIDIEDTGLGIETEDLKRLFDRFFRSNHVRSLGIEGSGIGLSILKSLCNSMDIKIAVTSTYGEGSTFSLLIPTRMKN